MSYKINGTTLAAQPASGKWVPQKAQGIDGGGHGIYPAYAEFEVTWEYISEDEFAELSGFFDGQGATGTVVVELPTYGSTGTYGYSGCVLRRPELDEYFQRSLSGVTMLIARIAV